ncbi:MAG: hypothetical protein JXP34_01715 [Planctomycetes bacterium]|nr:hypothetical protein [Planctomycetota bacterium]
MARIGLVDLDTSHAVVWLPILRELGAEVTAVFDHGEIFPPGYADHFARKHDIPHAPAHIEDMVPLVDGVLSLSVNWNVHLDHALPFLEAGLPVYLDKPIVGNVRDLDRFLTLARGGARLTGGSAMRVAPEVLAFLDRPASERGEILQVEVYIGVDEFSYGIHGIELLGAFFPAGALEVSSLGTVRNVRTYRILFGDARAAFLHVAVGSRQPFSAVVLTTKGVFPVSVDPQGLYGSLLAEVVPFLAGEGEPHASPGELAESIRIALAMRDARRSGGSVALADLRAEDPGYDGQAFTNEYRRGKLRAIRAYLSERGDAKDEGEETTDLPDAQAETAEETA